MSILEGLAAKMATGTNRLVLLASFILLALVFHFYGNTAFVETAGQSIFGWLYHAWTDSAPGAIDSSHGPLVILLSLFIVWQKRKKLAEVSAKVCPPALLIVLAGLLLHWCGLRAQQTMLSLASLILLIWAVPFYLYGLRTARMLIFPAAYLFFAIPWNFLGFFSIQLRLLASSSSEFLLNGLGLAIARVGTSIIIPGPTPLSLDVADPCSGLRSLTAMCALATAFAYYLPVNNLRKATLILASIPIAVISNIARVMSICFAAKILDTRVVLKFYHDYSGYVVFAVASLLITGLGKLLKKKETSRTEVPETAELLATTPGPSLKMSLLLPSALMLSLAIFPMSGNVTFVDESPVRLTLPKTILQWNLVHLAYCQSEQCLKTTEHSDSAPAVCPACGYAVDLVHYSEKTFLPEDTLLVHGRYRSQDDRWIDVAIVVSGQGRSSIHKPEWCLSGQGYSIINESAMTLTHNSGKTLPVRLLQVERKTGTGTSQRVQHAYFAYWFVGPTTETASPAARLLNLAYERIVSGKAYRWAYLSVLIPGQNKDQPLSSDLKNFLLDLSCELKNNSTSKQ